jgi:hypothetical protein
VTGEDVRFAVLTFSDAIEVVLPFTNDVDSSQTILGLTIQGNPDAPDLTDTPRTKPLIGGQRYQRRRPVPSAPLGPLGDYRDNCRKMAVLVTDALPGCNGLFTFGRMM